MKLIWAKSQKLDGRGIVTELPPSELDSVAQTNKQKKNAQFITCIIQCFCVCENQRKQRKKIPAVCCQDKQNTDRDNVSLFGDLQQLSLNVKKTLFSNQCVEQGWVFSPADISVVLSPHASPAVNLLG